MGDVGAEMALAARAEGVRAWQDGFGVDSCPARDIQSMLAWLQGYVSAQGNSELKGQPFERRVDLVRQSLLGIALENRLDRSGLFPLINAVLLLVQNSFVVSIYKRIDGSEATTDGTQCASRYVELQATINDRVMRPQFYEATQVFHVDTRDVPLVRRELRREHDWDQSPHMPDGPELIRLVGTAFYLVFWQVDMSGDALQVKVELNGEVRALVRALLGARAIDNEAGDVLTRSLTAGFAGIETALRRHRTKKECVALEVDQSRLARSARQRIEQVFNATYVRYAASQLLAAGTNGARISNVLFFTRAFDRSVMRCGRYRTNNYLMLGSQQAMDIQGALGDRETLKVLERQRLDGAYRSAEDQVFRWLEGLEGGRTQIIDVLRSPTQVHERMFIEYCISSGVVNFRKDPFGPDRLARIYPYMRADDDATHQARLRAVCLRMVMMLMAPGFNDGLRQRGNYSIVQVPVQVGGAMYGAIVHMRKLADADNNTVDEAAFFRTYHFAHSMVRHMVKDIRIGLRDLYCDMLGDEFRTVAKPVAMHGCDVDVEDMSIAFGKAVDTITRLLPFSALDLNALPRIKGEPTPEGTPAMGGMFVLRPELKENRWFDRYGASGFVSMHDVELALFAADNKAFAEHVSMTRRARDEKKMAKRLS